MKAGDLKRVHRSSLVKTALVQYLNCLVLPNYYKSLDKQHNAYSIHVSPCNSRWKPHPVGR